MAKRLSFLSKLACVNIPTSAIAGVLNNTNPLLFPPTPIAAAYHALGLGVFLPSSMLNSDSDEADRNCHAASVQCSARGEPVWPQGELVLARTS